MSDLDPHFDPILDEDSSSRHPSAVLGWSVAFFALGVSALIALFFGLLPMRRMDGSTFFTIQCILFVLGAGTAALAWRNGQKVHMARSLFVANLVFLLMMAIGLVFG